MFLKPVSFFRAGIPNRAFFPIPNVGTSAPVGRPAAPSAITGWSVAPGGLAGQAVITVSTLPALGDGAAAADGLGVNTGIEWKPEFSPDWIYLGPGLGDFTVSSPLIPGAQSIVLRVLGFGGRPGATSSPKSVNVPGSNVDLGALYTSDGQRLYSSTGAGLYALE